MASTAVPTLSTNGWVKTVNSKADFLLSYFFESQASQSTVFKGHIHSLSYILATHANSILTMESAINDSLSSMLLAYVDDVDVTTRITADDPSDSGKYNIYISATVVDKGEPYSLSYLVGTTNAAISKVIKNVNG